MSTNVFGPQNGPPPDFLRNVYDKQFQNLITTNFGDLRVCFCKEVLPGDSVNIDPVVAIRSQPIVFPIQTRMKFYCHFFYGRNRILMKDWEDFIFKTKDNIIPPLLRLTEFRAKAMISTGSLGDNLGIPSTFASNVPLSYFGDVSNPKFYMDSGATITSSRSFSSIRSFVTNLKENNSPIATAAQADGRFLCQGMFVGGFSNVPVSNILTSLVFSANLGIVTTADSKSFVVAVDSNNIPISPAYECILTADTKSSPTSYIVTYTIKEGILDFDGLVSYITNYLQEHDSYSLFFGSFSDSLNEQFNYYQLNSKYFGNTSAFLTPSKVGMVISPSGVVDATFDGYIANNKFVGNNPTIPLSALPFRLYEFICNYYYRNDTNNPYVLDNEPQYNKFIPTDNDGWDDNLYVIHKRNWESDMFTTCVPSPQFGTAPLVGLTYNGGLTAEVTTNVTDSDGQTQSLGIQVAVDDEGNITDIINADTGVPSGSLKSLMDAMSTTGISINTLRNVNSFQRFLENVIRRGLRYRNQLLSHFGVSVDYPDIDIPQFIGGFSGDLVVREVTNMAESSEVALGDVAGKIDAVIQSNHSINCYCAEHGFIMGIFCIVPVPTYSQVLPHMFTRYDAFDYFQKEFDKIGYVPVTYRNFLPLQSDNPDEVFGYQRAWYEYMSSIDEVHGDFRMSLDDFVLYRVFSDKPTLNESFLTVDSDSLNNIFAVDKVEEKYKNADKFMCQFYFQYSQKTMIPKHGVASLE